MSDKKKDFRDKLEAAMKAARIKQKRLADELGFDRDQRKWLGRLLKDGLERPNARTIEDLKKLAEKLNMDISLGVPYSTEARRLATRFVEFIARPPRVHIDGEVRDWRAKWRHQNPQFKVVSALFSPNELKEIIAEILGKTEIPPSWGDYRGTRYKLIWSTIVWPELRKHCEQRVSLKPQQLPIVESEADLYRRLEREHPAAFEVAVKKLGLEALKQKLEKNVAEGVDTEHLLWLIDQQFGK